jgi:probable rRNA maturation factor
LSEQETAGPSLRSYGGELVIFQKHVPGLTELALQRFIALSRRAAGLRGGVNVLVTSNAEMQVLNRRFRGKNAATDVLSFPAGFGAPNGFAGDIAISASIASQNARSLGHTPAEEIKILALHGILHLRGYDHERDQGRMARREKQLRAKLHLPLGLIERDVIERDPIARAAASAARWQPSGSRARRHP